MGKLTDIHEIRRLMAKYHFTFQKGYGQNFLINHEALNSIIQAADIDKNTLAVEIGPGFGTLTQALCEHAGKVAAIEIDARLLPVLEETLAGYDNVSVIHGDFLKLDFGALLEEHGGGLTAKIVANLPYYITTPIIMELLFGRYSVKKIVVMVQQEVARRMVASPGSKDYGALSIAVQYFCRASIACVVSARDFEPAPKVDSAVVALDVLDKPSVSPMSEELFFQVVKASFGQRRKTLKNALFNAGVFQKSKEEIGHAILNVCENENIRGEALSLDQFAKLSDLIGK